MPSKETIHEPKHKSATLRRRRRGWRHWAPGWTRPTLRANDTGDLRGQTLYASFEPLTAASLKIVAFDEDTSTVRPFEVKVTQVQSHGKPTWSIPSHYDYPADAQNQLADAATALMGLKILDVVSDSPGDHELYGVVDPEAKDLQVGATGVGTRVIMKDKKGNTLLSLILGKPVADRPDQHYVRRDDQDTVYVVAVKTDKLSGKFGDWIEKDLLNMNTFDIKEVWIRDYSVNRLQGELQRKGEIVLSFDDTATPKWKLVKDEKYQGDRWVGGKLAADEELNVANLDDMKGALENLKIVDVRRKPAGLSADLKANADFLNNADAVRSLGSCGYLAATVEGHPEFLSNDGEIRFLMKDGAEYVLRFGAAVGPGAKEKDAKKGQKDSGGLNLNRYLLVMAEFNPAAIAKPVLKELPALPAKDEKAGKAKSDAKAADAKKGDAKGEAGKAATRFPTRQPRAARPIRPRPPRRTNPPTSRPNPTSRPSANASKRKTSASERSMKRRSPRARSTSRNSTTASPTGITSFPTTCTARSISVANRSSRRRTRRTPTGRPAAASPAHEHGDHDHDDADEDHHADPAATLDKLKHEGPGPQPSAGRGSALSAPGLPTPAGCVRWERIATVIAPPVPTGRSRWAWGVCVGTGVRAGAGGSTDQPREKHRDVPAGQDKYPTMSIKMGTENARAKSPKTIIAPRPT